jgi:NAD(P)-dependent dehydrogenase (short-subunit alcohol dehydrogenase family)
MALRKIVTVTGGNGGIGYETVKALLGSDKPYHILMGSRSLDKANAAIETLHSECPGAANTVEPVQIDLTCDESIETAFKQVEASHGRIDVLINNAGKYRASLSQRIPSEVIH